MYFWHTNKCLLLWIKVMVIHKYARIYMDLLFFIRNIFGGYIKTVEPEFTNQLSCEFAFVCGFSETFSKYINININIKTETHLTPYSICYWLITTLKKIRVSLNEEDNAPNWIWCDITPLTPDMWGTLM